MLADRLEVVPLAAATVARRVRLVQYSSFALCVVRRLAVGAVAASVGAHRDRRALLVSLNRPSAFHELAP